MQLRARTILVLSLIIWASGSTFADDYKSAKRDPNTSYQVYKSYATWHSHTQSEVDSQTTEVDSRFNGKPVEVAKKYRLAKLPEATKWESQEVMLEQFRKMRDHRFLKRGNRPDFLRRLTWLYPDDGCYARAQLANSKFEEWSVPAPLKIFAFGDLVVDTPNSPSGSVTWWYHVAPLVEVDGVKYVLDPSIDSTKPLTLEEWLARQSTEPHDIEVAVCNSGSYTPYNACADAIKSEETEALRDQQWFLDPEWQRLKELGRVPEDELGELPPWN